MLRPASQHKGPRARGARPGVRRVVLGVGWGGVSGRPGRGEQGCVVLRGTVRCQLSYRDQEARGVIPRDAVSAHPPIRELD